MSQKPYQYNNKFDCSETNGFNIPQDAINEVNLFSIKYRYSYIELQKKTLHVYYVDRIVELTELNQHDTGLILLTPNAVLANKMGRFRT